MNDLDPKSWITEIFEGRGVIWLVVLAVWGGTANYISKLRQSNAKFRIVELVGEWCISGFAGLLVAYVCFEFNASWQMTCFMAGMAGHMGGRAIYILELKFKDMLGGKTK